MSNFIDSIYVLKSKFEDAQDQRGIISTIIDTSLVSNFRKQLPSLLHDKNFSINTI